MVKFSIIIVSYNVKYFLEQCLCSVKKAIDQGSMVNDQWETEVFVVDNNSSDDTVQYLQPYFPFVQFVSNDENKGFAKANNQALQKASGQYVLFLNPDTILPEDFFTKCQMQMETNQNIGALGVRMIDGAGKFLKESKRGFPATWASFCKLSGLTALFPYSKVFSKYYLGHLDQGTSHEVDALSGACMLIRKEALDKSGGFDERFFMYAEDIDLSYRIQQSGYANCYFAEVSIIHFKGESTKKNIRYVRLFYKAMIQFVQKHYPGRKGNVYVRFLKMAIGFRGLFAIGSLPLSRKKLKPQLQDSNFFLEGDECSIQEVKLLLPNSNRLDSTQVAGNEDKVILCEGEQFSFKHIIKRMSASPGRHYKIHSLNSSSIVGSNNSRQIGDVITSETKK
jgi:GT2 family glycosyltransferase